MNKDYKNKKRRPNQNNKRNVRKDTDSERVEKPTNDPSWYSKYPQLVSDTASLFFSNPLGSKVEKARPGTESDTNISLDYVPGIMTVNTIAVPGYSNTANSPVNAIARGIYSYIRHANSGHANYDSPDLMMYLLAVDTCYSFWASCVRAYGIARMYNVRSRYLAVQFLEAMGFDPTDILANLAQFRATINNFAVKMSSYAVPASMDFFRRHTDMYMKVYLDEPSPKAQSYMFKLAMYYTFDNTSQDGGKLLLNQFPSSKLTLSDVQTVMDSLINPIISDEDMNIMSGDILKAYTDGGIFKVPILGEEYVTPMVYDTVVLGQIENSVSAPDLESTTMGVTQDPTTSSIYFAPQISFPNTTRAYPLRILNLHTDSPTAMDVMEATRLMFSFKTEATGVKICDFGSEIVASYTLWNYEQGTFVGRQFFSFVNCQNAPANDKATQLAIYSNACSFNYHPRLIVLAHDNPRTVDHIIMDLFPLDNYTELDDKTLERISNTAMLSLFDVGHIALVQ